jgi:ATP synthase protein I
MAEDEIDETSKLPPDARLESLDERLDRAQRREAEKASAKVQDDPTYRVGQLVLSQLIGGPLGGGILGWLLDRWLGTAPWLMLGLLFLGFAGGMFNVIRISNNSSGAKSPEQE